MNWHDLLFAHWPIPAAEIRARVPWALELDLFEGQAWLGIVPFRMTGVTPRGLPSLPWISAFPEVNVRTYVTAGGQPGVCFFSLDAANPVAVAMARAWFHLPYFRARMTCRENGAGIAYESRRRDGRADFCASYRATGQPFHARRGALEYFLTERYCLYTMRRGVLCRGDIHHSPWPLQTAEAEIASNTMAAAASIGLPEAPPLLHFAKRLEVVAWPLEPVAV
jgi:hypothetical protein